MKTFILTKTIPSGIQRQFEGIVFTSGRVALDGDSLTPGIDCYESIDEMLRIFEVEDEAIRWIDGEL